MFDPYLSNLLQRNAITIVGIQTLNSGGAAWSRAGKALAFDAAGRWREVWIRLQRELRCEKCGTAFTHPFDLVTECTGSSQTTLALTGLASLVEQELRRRIRCPHCGVLQKEIRRRAICHERRHNWIGVLAIGGSLCGALAFCLGGYAIIGIWGLVCALGLSFALMLYLIRWMLAKILDTF